MREDLQGKAILVIQYHVRQFLKRLREERAKAKAQGVEPPQRKRGTGGNPMMKKPPRPTQMITVKPKQVGKPGPIFVERKSTQHSVVSQKEE